MDCIVCNVLIFVHPYWLLLESQSECFISSRREIDHIIYLVWKCECPVRHSQIIGLSKQSDMATMDYTGGFIPACLLWKLVPEEMLYVNYKSSIILVHKSQSLSGSSADSLAYSII